MELLQPGVILGYYSAHPERFHHEFTIDGDWVGVAADQIVVDKCKFSCLVCNGPSDIYTKNAVMLHFNTCPGDHEIVNKIKVQFKLRGSEKIIKCNSNLQSTKAYCWKGIALKFGLFKDDGSFICYMCDRSTNAIPTANKSGVMRHLLSCSGMLEMLDDFIEVMEMHGQGAAIYMKYVSPSKSGKGSENIVYHKNLINAKQIPKIYKKAIESGKMSDAALLSLDNPSYTANNEDWVALCVNYGVFHLDKIRFHCDSCKKRIYHDKKVVLRHLCLCLSTDDRKKFLELVLQYCPGAITKFELETCK